MTLGSPTSTITRPFTNSAVTSDFRLSAVVAAIAGMAIEIAVAPPSTLINSRRLIFFILSDSFLRFWGLLESSACESALWLTALYLKRRQKANPTRKDFFLGQNFLRVGQ